MTEDRYSGANKHYKGEHTTDFANLPLAKIKDMVRDAKPDKVEEIAGHWTHVYNQLAGDAEDGSVKDLLDKTVADVLEHWSGDAAKQFAERARKLSAALHNGALYAKNTSTAMKNAAGVLSTVQSQVAAIEDPGAVDRAMDKIANGFTRSDAQADKDIDAGMDAGKVAEKNEGDLSLGRERALEAAGHMELLGGVYVVQAKGMGSPPPPWVNPQDPTIPPPETTIPPVVFAPTPVTSPKRGSAFSGSRQTSGAGVGQTGVAVTSPRDSAVHGGKQSPSTLNPGAQTGTSLDGVRGGIPSTGSPTGGTGNVGSGGGAGGVGTGLIGSPGTHGAPARDLPGARPGRVPASGGSGRAGSGTPTPGGTSGRPGIGSGQGIVGGRPGAPSGRAGGFAGRPGGAVGATPGTPAAGRGPQGGAGLHRSRGAAAQAGAGQGARAGTGRAVPPVGRKEAEKEERRETTERPDYLVEDEETWAPRRGAAPRVIE